MPSLSTTNRFLRQTPERATAFNRTIRMFNFVMSQINHFAKNADHELCRPRRSLSEKSDLWLTDSGMQSDSTSICLGQCIRPISLHELRSSLDL